MFYSLQNTITVVKCAIVASVSNIILNFALIGPLAHKGLALATSLSSLVLVILLSMALRGRIGAGIYQGQHGFYENFCGVIIHVVFHPYNEKYFL